ncbi:response regulator [Mangrovicoccus algicola]|uniref:Response regulator transcription factor n=1 Tax=Mangrovicoccus algicola TaxID=2771008 RepID=A0A8J7CWV3_9RHOB|nr:response regulator transcription factor [Mangrovicoccus algicola]MBE3638217.1 response regulator transcription factor [Mangrovicoccus algicola]
MARLVFLLEDDADVAAVLRRALEDHGFEVERFARRADIVARLGRVRPDICLIDLGLPDGDGLSVVGHLLRDLAIPAIIVSGRGDVTDRVVGLELGADDYLVKPVEPRELVARVRSLLRRAAGAPMPEMARQVARFDGWSADFGACTLTDPRGGCVSLSAAEASLLRAFVTAAGRVLSRRFLLDIEGPSDLETFDRAMDVRISRLRRKLGDDPRKPRAIKTVYGAGYVFTPRVDWAQGPARGEPG